MGGRSLPEVHGSVPVPPPRGGGGVIRRFLAFAGPAYLVSVGYMDPGNWATDIAAGSRYGYALLWVLLLSNGIAILLQGLSARLGLVSGRDLAQACRERYPPAVSLVLWILCEAAIAATDLAEVVGSAIGLNLLFGLPLLAGVAVTALDTVLILFLHQSGIRRMEAFIVVLAGTIGACFLWEILLSRPSLPAVARGFVPSLPDGEALYFAMAILGATVMPHNLYLHSSLVQSRKVEKTASGIRQALRFNLYDSLAALNAAFLVNAAILVTAATAFHGAGLREVADIREAHRLLAPVVGSSLAPSLFAVALICAGQSSTITGTLAGQIVMEGFVNVRLRPWARRLLTRAAAIVPAVAVIALSGEEATGRLLVFSQVVLSLQLSFAVVPLVRMAEDRRLMGAFALSGAERLLAWGAAALVAVLNGKLVADTLGAWGAGGGGGARAALWPALPAAAALALLLAWLVAEPWLPARPRREPEDVHGGEEPEEVEPSPPWRRIAAALDFGSADGEVLARVASLAASARAPVLLVHVVESASARVLGGEALDEESRRDLERLRRYAEALGKQDVEAEALLGFGSPLRALPEIVREHGVDLLVAGAHGHRGVSDWLHGETIDDLRHRLSIAVLVVGPGKEGE